MRKHPSQWHMHLQPFYAKYYITYPNSRLSNKTGDCRAAGLAVMDKVGIEEYIENCTGKSYGTENFQVAIGSEQGRVNIHNTERRKGRHYPCENDTPFNSGITVKQVHDGCAEKS